MAPFRCSLIAIVAVALFTQSATAITAEDVMKKMSKEERFGYLTGLIDMLTYNTATTGNGSKAACLTNAYYREGKDAAWKNLYDALGNFSDKQPATIVTLLARKACGS